MTSRFAIPALALALAASACGVPEQQYQAALSDVKREMRASAEQRQRAGEAELQVAALRAKLGEQEQARKGLEATTGRLESEKAAAADEAARQRELAARLAEEKRSLEKQSSDYQALAASLDQEIKAGRVQVSELEGKLTVRMAERVLFPSGSAVISTAGKATLSAVADGLQAVKGRTVRVEGHTDNVPIHTERFPSNWELSAGRAIAVVRFLQEQGIEPTRLGAAGYSEYQPIAPNDSAEGRAQNRRIEITLAQPPGALPQAKPASP